MLIIALSYKSAKSMHILILILNLIYLCYIFAILPFKQVSLLIQTVVIEGIANVSLLLMVLYYFIADTSYSS